MKISEILVEAPNDATAKMKEFLRKNKGKLTQDELDAYFGKQGGKIGKIAPGTLVRDKNVAAQRDSSRQAGSYTKKTTTPTVITQPDAVTQANRPLPGADVKAVAKKAVTQANRPLPDAVTQANRPLPGADVKAVATTPKSASIVARDKYAGRDTNRGLDVGRGRDMSNADAIAQAGAKFDQSKPTAVAKPAKKIGIQPGKTPSADTMDNRNK